MVNVDISKVTPLIGDLISLLRVLVWPVFIWFFTNRPDVRRHIGFFRKLLARLISLRFGKLSIKLEKPVTVRPLPDEEEQKEVTVKKRRRPIGLS